MAFGQWQAFTTGSVQYEYDAPGVYVLGDSKGTVIYVGSSNELRRRLLEHLGETNTCISTYAALYSVDYCADYERREQEVYDEIVRATGARPYCNYVRPAGA